MLKSKSKQNRNDKKENAASLTLEANKSHSSSRRGLGETIKHGFLNVLKSKRSENPATHHANSPISKGDDQAIRSKPDESTILPLEEENTFSANLSTNELGITATGEDVGFQDNDPRAVVPVVERIDPEDAVSVIPLVKDPSSHVHFFKDAQNFTINDSRFVSAGRDVHYNITKNYLGDRSLSMLPYAEGSAGMDTTKVCLDGTRTDILAEIQGWISITDETAPRIFWLSGPAGTGKSAIAHTIAFWWMEGVKGIGSCFCFNRQAITRCEKLFPTIARDLADRIPGLRDYLIELVAKEPSLTTTSDVTQQWRKLIETPIVSLSGGVGPVVIIIDALDESGDMLSRRHILPILTKDSVNLPSNFRILVTSRPLPDITKAFRGASSARLKSMDHISRSSTESDIRLYISHQVRDNDDFDDQTISQLTQKADGLFEWARLACEYIKYAGDFLTTRERSENLVVHAGEGEALLDNMYMIILQSIIRRADSRSLERFRSVLRLVLSTREPLPMDALNALHSIMYTEHDYGVATVLQHLGPLLSGVSDQSIPIRTLHSTFYEFLTTRDRSGSFFVDLLDIDGDLGCTCLGVMWHELRFNICNFKNSYVRNSEITGFGQQVREHIKLHLSYSCRFWADHIRLAPYQESLAGQISTFLLNEKMLFWLEVLGLLNQINLAPTLLGNVVNWLQGSTCVDAVAAARDGISLCRMFGKIIEESTPHLYLSGLPFLPKNSILNKYLGHKFPRVPRIVSIKAEKWPNLQLSIRGHVLAIKSVAFSPDGKRIVSGSRDKTISIWDAETGVQLCGLLHGHTGWVMSVTFSPDGKRIVSGSTDRNICIWDAETGVQVGYPLQGHSGPVNSVVFSPDGKRIASGSHDQTIHIWDAETGMQVGSPLKGHFDWVTSVVFSPDGMRIASGSCDNTICIWDVMRGVQVGSPLMGHTDSVKSVAFSPDGKRVASGSDDYTVCIWDIETGVQMGRPLKGHSLFVNSVAFSPDGRRIVSGSHDRTVCIWEAETEVQVCIPLKGHTHYVNSVAFSPDGKRIVSGSDDLTFCIWDAEAVVKMVDPLKGHSGSVDSVAFSSDGKRIVSSSSDTTIYIWDAETGAQVGDALRGHTGRVNSVAISPDGKIIASSSDDRSICIWDTETGKQVGKPLNVHTSSVVFSPDGKRIASGHSDHAVYIWDVETRVQVGCSFERHTQWVNSVAFSPGGKRVASGSNDCTVCIWDVETGAQVWIHHSDRVKSVAFSPDGNRVASGSADSTICIWDAMTGMQVGSPLKGHTDSVDSITFLPDGKRVVSGAIDKSICIWDVETGVQVTNPLKGHTHWINSISVSPNGKRIASGSSDNTIAIWDAETVVEADSPLTNNTGDLHIHHVIKFSSVTEHALHSPSQLFKNTQELQQDWRSHVFLNDKDGWITGPRGSLLMWLPPGSREQLMSPKMHVMIPPPIVELDLSKMVHGYMWDQCYEG